MGNENIWIPILITVLAGLSTGIGSIASLFIKEFKHSYLSVTLGFSAGVMVYVSFVELLGNAIDEVGFIPGNLGFFGGIAFMFIVDRFLPHNYFEERVKGDSDNSRLMDAGVFTAIGIAIHNFPEGMGVLFSSINDLSLGIPLAVAIAIHNIPEGIAVSMPIYYATKSRKTAFLYSFFSGVAEPLGAIIGFFILRPFLNDFVLATTLAAVGGIMVFISFDELLPLSFDTGEEHLAIVGAVVGMAVMAISLALL
jgi:ZIP family zinc transporter